MLREDRKRYMPRVETHDDVPQAAPEECGSIWSGLFVTPVIDVHAVHLREDLVENTVTRLTGFT